MKMGSAILTAVIEDSRITTRGIRYFGSRSAKRLLVLMNNIEDAEDMADYLRREFAISSKFLTRVDKDVELEDIFINHETLRRIRNITPPAAVALDLLLFDHK